MLIRAGRFFSDAAQRFATQVALEDGTTYHQLDQRVGRVASALRSVGLGPGDRVGVLSHNRPELIELWLGLERAGLVRVVLHSHFDISVHADTLRQTGAAGLVFDTRFAA